MKCEEALAARLREVAHEGGDEPDAVRGGGAFPELVNEQERSFCAAAHHMSDLRRRKRTRTPKAWIKYAMKRCRRPQTRDVQYFYLWCLVPNALLSFLSRFNFENVCATVPDFSYKGLGQSYRTFDAIFLKNFFLKCCDVSSNISEEFNCDTLTERPLPGKQRSVRPTRILDQRRRLGGELFRRS